MRRNIPTATADIIWHPVWNEVIKCGEKEKWVKIKFQDFGRNVVQLIGFASDDISAGRYSRVTNSTVHVWNVSYIHARMFVLCEAADWRGEYCLFCVRVQLFNVFIGSSMKWDGIRPNRETSQLRNSKSSCSHNVR